MSPKYDLLVEPWIPVVGPSNRVIRVGFLDFFELASSARGFDFPLPIVYPAFLRVALAIVYRALEGPETRKDWSALWKAPKLPVNEIQSYLEHNRERFDLFSEVAPFFQSPGLKPAGGGDLKQAGTLIPYIPTGNNVPLFSPVNTQSQYPLSPGDAALWLLSRHAWGTTADKSGAFNNPLVKSGRDTPSTGPLGHVGIIFPHGMTIRETILLNLVPLIAFDGEIIAKDLPTWEQVPCNSTWTTRIPLGICDLFTWQSRRVILHPHEDENRALSVETVFVSAGDRVPEESLLRLEPQTSWRQVKPTGDSGIDYSPIHHDPNKQVWRGLQNLIGQKNNSTSTAKAKVLSWIGELNDFGELEHDSLVSLVTIGASYGTQNATIEELIVDDLDLPSVVLSSQDSRLQGVILSMITAAEVCAYRIRMFAQSKAVEQKWNPDEILYGRLDSKFRALLIVLTSEEHEQSVRLQWKKYLRTETNKLLDQIFDACSVDRIAKVCEAQRIALHSINKALNDFYSEDDSQDRSEKEEPAYV